MIIEEIHNKKLLVEGNDDQHVIWALCEKFSIEECFDVIDCGSKEKLIETIPLRIKQRDIETIGIIIDADTDIEKSWNALSNSLTKLEFRLPKNIPKDGFIASRNDNVRLGVWVMPNNKLNGMLEDFISFLIPKDDKLLPLVNDTLDTIENQKLNKYKLIHKSKSKIHTWLAWQEVPGTPLGLAITKQYLTTDEKNCLLLIDWLKRLFCN